MLSRKALPFVLFVALLAGSCHISWPWLPGSNSHSFERKCQTLGFSHYEFEQRFICFCPYPAGRFHRLLVKDGEIQSVVDVETGAALEQDKYNLFKTVDQLYAFIRNIESQSVDRLDVTYDSTYVYPTYIYVDYEEHTADEEFGYQSRNFQPLR